MIALSSKLESEGSQENEVHYYFENGLMVMTESYHLDRGYCCGNKCRNCPYEHKNVEDSPNNNQP